MTLVSMISVMKKLHFLITIGMGTSYTYLALQYSWTACLYPITVMSLQDLSSNLPSSFWSQLVIHILRALH